MRTLLVCAACLVLLSCLSAPVESRTLHVDNCSVIVHTHELRKYYSDLRPHAISEDSEIGVRLLDRSLMKGVQEGQTCCFLRLLMRFYVERVFGNYASSGPQQKRSSSALANAFVSIRRDVHTCVSSQFTIRKSRFGAASGFTDDCSSARSTATAQRRPREASTPSIPSLSSSRHKRPHRRRWENWTQC
ncbi:interleukin 19 like isoform 1-T1 [Menidia menidia]